MDIGVRELKAKLSSMLQRAAAGEHITVTDRGRPIAVLGPPLGGVDLSSAATEGWVTLPSSNSSLRPVRRARAQVPVLDLLAEDRGE